MSKHEPLRHLLVHTIHREMASELAPFLLIGHTSSHPGIARLSAHHRFFCVPQTLNEQRSKRWRKGALSELAGTTVGLPVRELFYGERPKTQFNPHKRRNSMHKVSIRKVKTPMSYVQDMEEEVLHFSLQGLLPTGHTLALNTTLGTLSHLAIMHDRPHMLMEQQFTTSEICVLLPLLESYPYYCPYEVLLASFTTGRVTEAAIERCRQRLQEAQEEGVWDQEMRPVRNVLSRTRIKTRTFGIEISSILETGYILMYSPGHKKREKEG
ncbi:hypothetical protein [Thermosporothrix hazakensis]|uniref:hypothetical protein n=1 Tax=Thermosporothrix hazakensis TaxID=644383 RepID=UPI001FE57D18|nr:hypothetical protein [Thermosporothrix hazakensis]